MTITREFTKEQLQQIEAAAKEVLWPVVWTPLRARKHFEEKIAPDVVLKLARIALASLEAEPVGWFVKMKYMHSHPAFKGQPNAFPLFSAPPAPASVPDEVTEEDCPAFVKYDITEVDEAWARGFNACRAAMLNGVKV